MNPASFMRPLGSRDYGTGNVYEMRIYTYAPGTEFARDSLPSVPREGPTRRDGFIRLSSGGSEAHHWRSAISTARSGRRSPPGP
jgi:hypothetical protein